MKKLRLSLISSILFFTVAPVFAAGAERTDDSHLLTYIFLAVCGLIVLLQVVPVVSLVKGVLKGLAVKQGRLELEELKTQSKYR